MELHKPCGFGHGVCSHCHSSHGMGTQSLQPSDAVRTRTSMQGQGGSQRGLSEGGAPLSRTTARARGSTTPPAVSSSHLPIALPASPVPHPNLRQGTSRFSSTGMEPGTSPQGCGPPGWLWDLPPLLSPLQPGEQSLRPPPLTPRSSGPAALSLNFGVYLPSTLGI